MSNENNIVKTLTKSGIVGVMIGLILLAGAMGYFTYKVTSNHIEHNITAWEANTESGRENAVMISDSIIESAKATTEMTTYLRTKLE